MSPLVLLNRSPRYDPCIDRMKVAWLSPDCRDHASFWTKLTHGISQGQIQGFKKVGGLVHGDEAYLGGPISHAGGGRGCMSPILHEAWKALKQLICWNSKNTILFLSFYCQNGTRTSIIDEINISSYCTKCSDSKKHFGNAVSEFGH